MGPKVESYIYKSMSDIFINRINCTKETIVKILDLFALKSFVLEISNVQRSDVLYEKIKQLNLRYTTSLEDKSPCFDVALMSNKEQFKEIIDCIVDSDSETLAIINMGNRIQWEQFLHNKIPVRKLIKQGIININISVGLQESSISISLRNNSYNAKQIVTDIKTLFRDKRC
jgi:hypothetical protein